MNREDGKIKTKTKPHFKELMIKQRISQRKMKLMENENQIIKPEFLHQKFPQKHFNPTQTQQNNT